MSIEREIQIANTFIIPAKRGRYVGLLNSKKGRLKFLERLYHFPDFDPRCIVELSGASDTASGLIAELRRRGAAEQCYVMSVSEDMDGVVGPIEELIREVFASVEGTIVCCVPGSLAYYEGDAPKNRLILHRWRFNRRMQGNSVRSGGRIHGCRTVCLGCMARSAHSALLHSHPLMLFVSLFIAS